MRRLSTLLFLLFVCFFSSLSSQDFSGDDKTIVMKLNEFDEDINMAVYSAFEKDAKLAIINSCDALGLIVFAPKSGQSISKAQLRSYVTVRMNELKAQIPSSFEYVDELSASEVLIQCRQKMQELFNEESK